MEVGEAGDWCSCQVSPCSSCQMSTYLALSAYHAQINMNHGSCFYAVVFLKVGTSARTHIHISYTQRKVSNGLERFTCQLYLERSLRTRGQVLVTRHPLLDLLDIVLPLCCTQMWSICKLFLHMQMYASLPTLFCAGCGF